MLGTDNTVMNFKIHVGEELSKQKTANASKIT
jgi:hypothetical protein